MHHLVHFVNYWCVRIPVDWAEGKENPCGEGGRGGQESLTNLHLMSCGSCCRWRNVRCRIATHLRLPLADWRPLELAPAGLKLELPLGYERQKLRSGGVNDPAGVSDHVAPVPLQQRGRGLLRHGRKLGRSCICASSTSPSPRPPG